MVLQETIEAAREAGSIAMRHFRTGHASWEKGPGQIVTAADVEIDAYLAAVLPEITPAAWLSEETEDDLARLAAERLWIVDPIDGTRSFAQGKPEFTISIALVENGLPILGVVYNPALDEMFTCERGQGAHLGGRAIAASQASCIEGAKIVVSHTENRRRHFAELFPQAHVTEIGSLAYKLARVAAGHFDAYFSWRRAHDWDIAAAILLLEEAGALISDSFGEPIELNGEEADHKGIIAAAGGLHPRLVAKSVSRRSERAE